MSGELHTTSLLMLSTNSASVDEIPDDSAGVMYFGTVNPHDEHFLRWFVSTPIRVFFADPENITNENVNELVALAALDGRRTLVLVAKHNSQTMQWWLSFLREKNGVN